MNKMPVLLSVAVVRLSSSVFRWSVSFMEETLETGLENKRAKALRAGYAFRERALAELKEKTKNKGVRS